MERGPKIGPDMVHAVLPKEQNGSLNLGWTGCGAALVVSGLMFLALTFAGAVMRGDLCTVGVRLRNQPGFHRLDKSLLQPIELPTAAELNADAAQYPDIASACSAEYRARNAAAVQNGSSPALLHWECKDIPQCGWGQVRRLGESYRQRQARDFLELVPCDFFKAIHGRTLWIVGDSQQQGFYKEMRCFLRPFLEKVGEGSSPRWHANFTDDPWQRQLLFERIFIGHHPGENEKGVGMPWCTYLVGSTRICHIRVNRGYHLADDFLPNWGLFNMSRSDIVVLNIGLWHHDENYYAQYVQQLAEFYKANRARLPLFIWRDTSPQHFNITNGEYPDPKDVPTLLKGKKECEPMKDVLLLNDGTLWGKNEYLKMGGWRNIDVKPYIQASGMSMLACWNETVPLYDMHCRYPHVECSHFCSPGGYSIWIWKLWQLLHNLPQVTAQP